ncbi:radical SAM protein [Bremerella sp. T1]|uniref:radical SAM protein n=1 Tax=Bremerella sp. TYQ1 TaxID=3119568 RepID=UPI001CCF2B8D|nr:radical SAM protein [Bremerella volcania]UBM37606.1 radical SAM protein [Bremerella volcania]
MKPVFRDYTVLGTTQSLCPECLAVVPAKIITRGNRVYFRKRCELHGTREDFVCSDVAWYDQAQFNVPGKIPHDFAVEPNKGCPLDCGLCTEHEQHTCIGLLEITSSCNLACPMCYASSGPGGKHLTLEQCQQTIDRYVEMEGNPEVLQLSGGEPTIHPQFREILTYALSRPIDYVMINTNGIRLAHDPALLEYLANRKDRVEIYLQFDGFRELTSLQLRGEELVETKLKAVEKCGEVGLHVNLVATLQPGVNDDELGKLVDYCARRPWITGLSLQPATYSGRHVLPEELENRITFPDVIRGIAEQTNGRYTEADFMPLPCAHPNCHQMSYAYRRDGELVPLMRFIKAAEHLDLLSGGISFQRGAVKELLERYLVREACCPGGSCAPPPSSDGLTLPVLSSQSPLEDLLGALNNADPKYASAAVEFFTKAMQEQLGAEDVFRIMITSFLDAYNFDVRRVMKCCVHHLLPSGHFVPFCAYNVLYREGHVELPPLKSAVGVSE